MSSVPGASVDTVEAMHRRVRELGVTGVPFFIFDGRVAVPGAQEPQTLVSAMAAAMAPTAVDARQRLRSPGRR